MLKDSRSYEVQIIDAVRSVNRALGGTYGTSSAIYKSEFNQYEVQLIDAIKGIGRTLSGKGLSGVGGFGGGASEEALEDLAKRVTKLESESFFRLVDGNVTLKEQYSNLWVPGWLAAGGVGTGGGGGASTLSGLEDVSINTGTLADGHVLTWDASAGESGMWVNKPNSGGGGDPSTYVTLSDTQTITGAKTFTQAITAPRIAGGASTKLYIGNSNNSSYVHIQEDTYLAGADLKGATSQSNANSNNPSWYILKDGTASFSSLTVNGAAVGGGYIGYTSVQSTAQEQYLFGIPYINATNSASSKSRMIWDSTNEAWHFYGNVYADGWIAAGGVGSGGGGGASSLSSLSDVSLSSPSNGQALVYRSGVWQNETIQGGTTVSWGSSGSDYQYLSVGGTSKKLLTEHQSLSNYVTLTTTQEISGAKTFKDNDVTLAASSGLSVHQNSHIDIGPIRIKFENNAIHITKKSSSDTNNYGIYADGFVAAGGIQ